MLNFLTNFLILNLSYFPSVAGKELHWLYCADHLKLKKIINRRIQTALYFLT